MLAADALTGSGGGHRGEPLSQQQGRALGRRPWKDGADFAAGTSTTTSCGGLSVVLQVKVQLRRRNCSCRVPQRSTSKPCKLLNLLMRK